MLRIGLAGLGHGGTLLEANDPGNARLPMRVTAVCDTDEGKIRKAVEEYGIEDATTDFGELIGRKDLDIVGIYTPGPLHAAQILSALEAGKHVMVTKSMVYTMEEAEMVVKAVEETGAGPAGHTDHAGPLRLHGRQGSLRRRRDR